MKQFTNLYQVAKTLRFELIPDERTKAYLEHSDLIAKTSIVQKVINSLRKSLTAIIRSL